MNEQITIEGDQVRLQLPEGQSLAMPLEAFLAHLAPPSLTLGNVILPDGVKTTYARGRACVWVHESPPRPYCFQWLANDSPAKFGPGATYRKVRIALPYMLLLAVFEPGPGGALVLGRRNECYFRTAPLKSLDDELLYPALLNCSKIQRPDGRFMSWVCSQYLNYPALARETDPSRGMVAGFDALRHQLYETGWNYSSEHHEGTSFYSESIGVDPRISTVENWEAASAKDPMFVLEVPWLRTGLTLRQVLDSMLAEHGGPGRAPRTSRALARIIINHHNRKRPASWMQKALLQ